ncbi:kinase [Sphingomonas sp. SUN019]|uniref:kinase n=1 Tax=Sphingomonas sp. SUN019 TaxID=2937788 RepID=UPI002164DE20|nr:kinase [Sphingomonas sp. SUN019]UVO50676.1 kinase [Sphingomonas sp. SUN019]
MTDALTVLIAREGLPGEYRDQVARWWRPLAAEIAAWRRAAGRPLVVGINGAQGSGKTTLCAFLTEILLPELGLTAVTLALDDFYLPRAERGALARDIHPLLATRGVPGTHDVAAGIAVLDALKTGDGRTVEFPVFDKSRDDRAATPRAIIADADVILFEGWCVGASPQPAEALSKPINALEAEEDRDGRWRGHVNDVLSAGYARWFAEIDRLVMLRPPDFAAVLANRQAQETKLRARTGRGMTTDEVARFVQHYERLTRAMFAEMPDRADLTFLIDARQRVIARSP